MKRCLDAVVCAPSPKRQTISKLSALVHEAASVQRQTSRQALLQIRELIIGAGLSFQSEAYDHGAFDVVVGIVTPSDTHPSLFDAACRLLCTITVKNTTLKTITLQTAGVEVALVRALQACATDGDQLLSDEVEEALPVTPCAPLDTVFCASGAPSSSVRWTKFQAAVGAAWALSAIVPGQRCLADRLIEDADAIKGVLCMCHSNVLEVQDAALWLLQSIFVDLGSAETRSAVNDRYQILVVLERVLRNSELADQTRSLAALTVRSLVMESSSALQTAAAPARCALMDFARLPTTPSNCRSVCMLALQALVHNNAAMQTQAGCELETVVSFIDDCTTLDAKTQACGALYSLCARCPANEAIANSLNALEKLCALLPSAHDCPASASRILSTMVLLSMNNKANKDTLAACRALYPEVVFHAREAAETKVRGVALALMASMVQSEDEELFGASAFLFAAWGALPCLCLGVQTRDKFICEQALLATMHLCECTNVLEMFDELGMPLFVADVLKRFVKKGAVPLTAQSMYSCIKILSWTAWRSYTPADDAELVTALCCFARLSIRCSRVQTAASTLLTEIVAPGFNDIDSACRHLLAMLPPATTTHGHVCPICMSDAKDDLVFLPCFHVLHQRCLHEWIVSSKRDGCPTCKCSVFSSVQNAMKVM